MTAWAGQAVLVTGYGGFLGGWLAQALQGQGAHVLGLVHRAERRADHPAASGAAITSVCADICDPAALPPILARHPVTTVFHLAAQTLPTLAREEPQPTFEVNAQGACNVLEAARTAAQPPRVIFGSTDSVYGENGGVPFTEESGLAPNYPYEASKACAEMTARCYFRTYGLPVAIARFCNLYGPGDVAESRLMAGTIAAALAGTRQVLRGDGSAVRNYLYVNDAVRALLTLAEALGRPGIAGQAFNFCDEAPYSVLDIASRVLALAGRPDLAPVLGVSTPGEISIKRASAEKARRVLGWAPLTGLDEGLAQTIAWHRARYAAAA